MKKIAAILLAGLISSGTSWALNSTSSPQEKTGGTDRFFISITAYTDSFKGDFDGNLVLGNAGKAFFIPKLNSQHGFGLSFGRTLKSGLWSISYLRAAHNTTFQGARGNSTSNILDINGKAYLFKKIPVLPYVLLGFTIPWLKVKNGAQQGNLVEDATYWGLGVNAGAGLIVPINSRFFISGGFVYRFMGFIFITGAGRGKDVTNLYVNRTGPRRDIFLRVTGLNFELSVGVSL